MLVHIIAGVQHRRSGRHHSGCSTGMSRHVGAWTPSLRSENCSVATMDAPRRNRSGDSFFSIMTSGLTAMGAGLPDTVVLWRLDR